MAAPPDDEYEAPTPSDTSASVSPNSVSDQPSRVDTLGFKPYVEAVAVFLTHPGTHPPLTLSVEGSWGSGKSSFMLQLEDRVRAKGGKTVWFNAWRHDKEDELWAAFALDFTGKLAATLPRWKRWLLHLKLSYLRFDWEKGWFQAGEIRGSCNSVLVHQRVRRDVSRHRQTLRFINSFRQLPYRLPRRANPRVRSWKRSC